MKKIIVTLGFLAACGKNGLDKGDRYALEVGPKDLAKAKEKLAGGEDVTLKCAGILSYATRVEGKDGAAAFVEEAKKVCGYEAPLKVVELETVKAEEARARQQSGVVTECFSGPRRYAVKTLAAHAGDAAFRALEERWAKACPPKK